MMFHFALHRRNLLLVLGLTLIGAALVAMLQTAPVKSQGRTLYVDSVNGNDTNGCGSSGAPCKSIQKALNLAFDDRTFDTVLVAAGLYTYAGDNNPCYLYFQRMRSVLCVVNQQLTIRGGYAAGDWENYDPARNVTVIDGQGQYRNIFISSTEPQRSSNVDLAGFTVRSGVHQGLNPAAPDQAAAFGGGLLADLSYLALTDMVFDGNVARGAGGGGAGGIAHGGAVVVRSALGVVTVRNTAFRNNLAEGGYGQTQGGFAYGGAFYTLNSNVLLEQVAFTGNRALGGGRGNRSDDAAAYGGGMVVQSSAATLNHVTFEGNLARGGQANAEGGDAGVGGALAIRGSVDLVSEADRIIRLNHVVFRTNRAEGGNGVTRGGLALGGALFTYFSLVEGDNLEFHGNVAQAGSAPGAGRGNDGETADANGGAVAFQMGSTVTLRNFTAYENQAYGGNATVEAGGGFGGAFAAEGAPWDQGKVTTINLLNGDLRNNLSQGANGEVGGLGNGGAINTLHAGFSMGNSFVLGNRALGGDGRQQGAAGGGGLVLGNIADNTSTAFVTNSVIALNQVRAGQGSISGGGGGGVWLQSIRANFVHNTIAGNRLLSKPLLGAGFLLINFGAQAYADSTVLNLSYNIIADHHEDSAGNGDLQAALFVRKSDVYGKPDNRANLMHNLFANNLYDFNSYQPGIVEGIGTSVFASSAEFLSTSRSGQEYRIAASSPAVNAGIGSELVTDILGRPRVDTPDIGAWESEQLRLVVAPIGSGMLSLSWSPYPDTLQYRLSVTCPAGANWPEQIDCGGQLTLPANITYVGLTGLTNNVIYDINLEAQTPDYEWFRFPDAQGTPTDNIVMLPSVFR